MSTSRQRVVISGASGLIGGALSASLRADGHEVVTLVRRAPQATDERSWEPAERRLDPAVLREVDAVVNLNGVGVADARWSPARKRAILTSRVDSTATLAAAVAACPHPPRLVNASAVGLYGDRGDEHLPETAAAGEGFLAEVVRGWEEATLPATEAGASVALARTGVVLGAGGGALRPMLMAGRLGLGGPLAGGRQWVPWISLEDEVRALRHLLGRPDLVGPVNLVAPAPVRQRDLARTIGERLGRPAVVPTPRAGLRVVLGEMTGELLASQRVVPEVLARSGFSYHHPEVGTAIAAAVG